jgi:3-hydroxypropanoate dehydrogenase
MATPVSDHALDQLFRSARTYYAWKPEPVPTQTLHDIYELFKLGPTSVNCSPARVVFLTTEEAKARLLPCLAPNNVVKSQTAPAVALIAYDIEFYEQLPKLFPFVDARPWFAGNPKMIEETAIRNGTLQGGYFILAARALGLDCGPMSGFDQAKVNAEFFPDGKWKANFVCNLGHGDATDQYPRAPRLPFDEACIVL